MITQGDALLHINRMKKIAEAIDVSAALDNCFFHSLALFFLTRPQFFPKSLFDKNELDAPSVQELKKFFVDDIAKQQLTTIDSNKLLFDKTLILGVLLRSWFVQQLFVNKDLAGVFFECKGVNLSEHDLRRSTFLQMVTDYKEAYLKDLIFPIKQLRFRFEEVQNLCQLLPIYQLCNANDIKELETFINGNLEKLNNLEKNPTEKNLTEASDLFKTLIELFDVVDKKINSQENLPDELISVRKSLIFDLKSTQTAVKDFFAKYEEHSIFIANRPFFNEKNLIIESQNVFNYWQQEGYSNYCNYLSNPGVKITYADIDPVLSAFLPYAIFSETDGSIIVDNKDAVFCLALSVQSGHYKLIPDESLAGLAADYREQHKLYLRNREDYLSQKIDAVFENSLFWRVTLPEHARNAVKPIDLLVEELPQFLKSIGLSKEEEVAPSAIRNTEAVTSVLPEATHPAESAIESPQTLSGSNDAPQELLTTVIDAVKLNTKLVELQDKLKCLDIKIKLLEQAKTPLSSTRAEAANALYIKLNQAFVTFVNSDKSTENFKIFSDESLTAIQQNRDAFETHREDYGLTKQVVGNIALAILGLGVLYGLALVVNKQVNGRFLFFAPETAQQVSKIETMIPKVQ